MQRSALIIAAAGIWITRQRSGMIGTEMMANSAPDGYTVLLITTTHAGTGIKLTNTDMPL